MRCVGRADILSHFSRSIMPLLRSGRILTIRGYRVNPAELMLLSIEDNVRNRREEALYFRRITPPRTLALDEPKDIHTSFYAWSEHLFSFRIGPYTKPRSLSDLGGR